MAIPISNISISKIADELGLQKNSALSISSIFEDQGISKYGLDPAYCSGLDYDARLANLRTSPYRIGKFRNYKYGLVFIQCGTEIYNYNHADGSFVYVASVVSGNDIAMSDTKFWSFNGIAPTQIYEYNLNQATQSISYSRTINISGTPTPITGLTAMDNYTLLVGGNGKVTMLDISGSTASILSNFTINGQVEGDILYMPESNCFLVTETYSGGYYLSKYSLSGTLINSNNIGVQSYAMYSHRDVMPFNGQILTRAYLFSVINNLYQINTDSLTLTLVRNNTGIQHPVKGAANTFFNMRNF